MNGPRPFETLLILICCIALPVRSVEYLNSLSPLKNMHGDDMYHTGPHFGYYGSYVGSIVSHSHNVNGDVYVADVRRIIIRDFSYDGEGPDPIFLAGDKKGSRFTLNDVRGRGEEPIRGHLIDQDIILEVPAPLDMSEVKWLSVFSVKTGKSYGDVEFPFDYQIPGQRVIGPLAETRERNKVSSGYIRILDAQTFLIPEFYFDGRAPGVYWWVTKGPRPSPSGHRLLNEVGSDSQLGRYSGGDAIIALPDNATIYDYDWLSLWSADYYLDLGHVRIPHEIKVPPSPRMFENLSPTIADTPAIPPGASVSAIRVGGRHVYYDVSPSHSDIRPVYRKPPPPSILTPKPLQSTYALYGGAAAASSPSTSRGYKSYPRVKSIQLQIVPATVPGRGRDRPRVKYPLPPPQGRRRAHYHYSRDPREDSYDNYKK